MVESKFIKSYYPNLDLVHALRKKKCVLVSSMDFLVT